MGCCNEEPPFPIAAFLQTQQETKQTEAVSGRCVFIQLCHRCCRAGWRQSRRSQCLICLLSSPISISDEKSSCPAGLIPTQLSLSDLVESEVKLARLGQVNSGPHMRTRTRKHTRTRAGAARYTRKPSLCCQSDAERLRGRVLKGTLARYEGRKG